MSITTIELEERIAKEAEANNGHVMGCEIGAEWMPISDAALAYLIQRSEDYTPKHRTVLVETSGPARHLRIRRDASGFYVRYGLHGRSRVNLTTALFVAQTPKGYRIYSFSSQEWA